jgi:ribokinase
LGHLGSVVVAEDGESYVPAFRVKAVDATAAGDIFCGAFAVACAEEMALVEAVRFATAASAISVTRVGAQPSAPTRSEILGLLSASPYSVVAP